MKRIFVTPCEGRFVRHPVTREPIPKEGRFVEPSSFWKRRIDQKDVTVLEKEPKKEQNLSKKNPQKQKD